MDRQERRYRTSVIVRRRWKVVKYNSLFPFCSYPHPHELCERCIRNNRRLRGRCRKTAPFDCGHSHCFCCHCYKILGELKMRDRRAEVSYYEQLSELYNLA